MYFLAKLSDSEQASRQFVSLADYSRLKATGLTALISIAGATPRADCAGQSITPCACADPVIGCTQPSRPTGGDS